MLHVTTTAECDNRPQRPTHPSIKPCGSPALPQNYRLQRSGIRIDFLALSFGLKPFRLPPSLFARMRTQHQLHQNLTKRSSRYSTSEPLHNLFEYLRALYPAKTSSMCVSWRGFKLEPPMMDPTDFFSPFEYTEAVDLNLKLSMEDPRLREEIGNAILPP